MQVSNGGSSSTRSAAEAAAAVLRGEGKKLQRKDRKAEISRIRAELGLADSGRTPNVCCSPTLIFPDCKIRGCFAY